MFWNLIRFALLLTMLTSLLACGDDGRVPVPDATIDGGGDTAVGDSAPPDTMADTGGDTTVPPGCGNGAVDTGEQCDTAIASGDTGACPTSCDDGDMCTTDTLMGMECDATCVADPITVCSGTTGDGCCPGGCDGITDADCMATCGNSVLEASELCENGTAAPCPTSCDDGSACTTDILGGGSATCDAACTFTDVTACSLTGDGCCPSACDSTTDADCSATCGNMTLDSGETCDVGSATPCPATCDDSMACTADRMMGSAAMCNVMCSNSPITACDTTSDGCCPGACNETTDADCMPVCGNRIVETGEDCDDGNTDATDGCDMCSAVATAFRLTSMDLRDPHAFASIGACIDVTSILNGQIQDGIQMDGDGDGLLDLSFVIVFKPLNQTAPMGGMVEVTGPDCTSGGTTVCTLPASMTALATTTYRNVLTGASSCLDTSPGGTSVVRPYTPAITEPAPPCFVSDSVSLSLVLSGIAIDLRDAQIAGSFVGSPATSITDGLMRGFITETDAEATILPSSLPLVGGMTLASLLRGGMGSCDSDTDVDTHPVHGTGWWFFLEFPASEVAYTEL